MRRVRSAAPVALALALAGGVASAQPKPPTGPAQKYTPQPLILQRDQLGNTAMASVGRTRMRNGDCAGALDAFDAALRRSEDPTVNRDRGLCEEQLGDAYPAIDDYRVYLTSSPDAPDADGIRQRLARLEQETTGRSSASSDVPDTGARGGSSARASMEVSAGASAGSPSPAAQRDKMDYVDRDDDAQSRSPYRGGKGWALAPFFAEHKWLGGTGASFGDASTWSEAVGLQVRYSLGRSASLVVEAGYEHLNTTDVDPATVDGLTSQVAYELRFPLDPDYDDQLLLVPGVGYEHAIVSPTDPQFQSATLGAVVPRVRFGYRHMIAATVAFDVGIDGGWSKFFEYGGSSTTDSATTKQLLSTSVLAALGVGVGWGL